VARPLGLLGCQAANAARREDPEPERVADVPRVSAPVVDGRAWQRRSESRYDVVEFQPMPVAQPGDMQKNVDAFFARYPTPSAPAGD